MVVEVYGVTDKNNIEKKCVDIFMGENGSNLLFASNCASKGLEDVDAGGGMGYEFGNPLKVKEVGAKCDT